MKIETIKLWNDRDDVELTTFLNISDPFFNKDIKRPAVIVCPGGAYQSCPRHGNEGDPVAMAFAIDGYQAFVLEYSVTAKAPEGKTTFPAQLYDLGKAILTVREHAEEWSINADQIAIIGFSAGAHLCGMYSVKWHTNLLADYFECDAGVFKPMAAVLAYGIFDYTMKDPPAYRPAEMNAPLFGCADPDEELLKEYSSVCQVTDKMPPAFLVAATDDGLVPAMQTIRMAEKLQRQNVPYECHLFQYGEHGFALGKNLFEPFKQEMTHVCAQWVPLAKIFLMHLISPETLGPEESPFKDLNWL